MPSNQYLNILQVNVNKQHEAVTHTIQYATTNNIDILLISEPPCNNKGIPSIHSKYNPHYRHTGTKVRAMALVLNPLIKPLTNCLYSSSDTLTITLQDLAIISVYAPKHESLTPLLDILDSVTNKCNKIILAGDMNAKSLEWNSPTMDHRGEQLSLAFAQLDLKPVNNNTLPTFDTMRDGTRFSSFIDVTAVSSSILSQIHDWKMHQGICPTSDHRAITFTYSTISKLTSAPSTTLKWNTKTSNWAKWTQSLQTNLDTYQINTQNIINVSTPQQLDTHVTNLTLSIQQACTSAMRPYTHTRTQHIPWWTERLTLLKKQTKTAYRLWRQCFNDEIKEILKTNYLSAKLTFLKESKTLSTTSWKNFLCNQTRETAFSKINRILKHTHSQQPTTLVINNLDTETPQNTANALLDHFFPLDDPNTDTPSQHQTRHNIDVPYTSTLGHDIPFTICETYHTINTFNAKKSPGHDGLTPTIVKNTFQHDPDTITSVLNKCLELGHFPKTWKHATVIPIHKPGKDDPTSPSSYRPIGLLPVFGKVLEKLIVGRLKHHLAKTSPLHPLQFGFSCSKSTTDALLSLTKKVQTQNPRHETAIVSLDIKAAFDSLWWPSILKALKDRNTHTNIVNLIHSYLSHRSASISYAGCTSHKNTTLGCVQGSVLGPLFWNITIDPLLHLLNTTHTQAQAYADDIILAITAPTTDTLTDRIKNTILTAKSWCSSNKLHLNDSKTQIMLIRRKVPLTLHINNTIITSQRNIKILGVILDHKLNFNTHLTHTIQKTFKTYQLLQKMAKPTWGLHTTIIQTLYHSVIEPKISYGAPVWYHTTTKKHNIKKLNRFQRPLAQMACKAHRTTSLNSTQAIAGFTPLDLLIQQTAKIFFAKRGESIQPTTPLPPPLPHHLTHPATPHYTETHIIDSHPNPTLPLELYTDGSKTETGVGAAFLAITPQMEILHQQQIKLAPHCSIFQAEALAIYHAILWAISSTDHPILHIYTDSQSCALALKDIHTTHHILHQIHNSLQTQHPPRFVHINWIRGHTDCKGNNLVDSLARDTANNPILPPMYTHPPFSHIKHTIKQHTLKQWANRYTTHPHGNVTQSLLTDPNFARKILSQHHTNYYITQTLTGHGSFRAHLHNINKCHISTCPCGYPHQTVSHMLLECPSTANIRHNTNTTLNTLADYTSLLETDPQLALNLFETIARHTQQINK